MTRKFIYLINPISGTKNKEALKDIIIEQTYFQKIDFEILPTDKDGKYLEVIEAIHTKGITDIIVCGGDGTINQVVFALLGLPVNIGIIPMGSGNGLALAAGIPKNYRKALQIIFTGNALETDGFFINEKFSCMLCGLGFDAQVAHDFAKQKKRGLATYVQQTIKNFISAPAYPFEISIGEKIIQTDAYFISIANSNQFGNHVTIAPRASISDGLLDIVVVAKMTKLKLLFSVAKQIFNGKVDATMKKKYAKNDIQYYQTKSLTIENLGNAPLHIDGDPVETHPSFTIKIKEKAFKLLQPNP